MPPIAWVVSLLFFVLSTSCVIAWVQREAYKRGDTDGFKRGWESASALARRVHR